MSPPSLLLPLQDLVRDFKNGNTGTSLQISCKEERRAKRSKLLLPAFR